MTDHYVGLKRNAELGCAMEMDIMVVPREDPKMYELSADVYWGGPEGHTVSETLKVCSIKIGNGQKTDLLMEDLVTVESGDQGNSELGVAAGLPDGTMASPVSGKSAGVSDTSSWEHDVAAGLLDATVVTEAGDIDSSEHKVAAGLSYVADLTSCTPEKEGASSAKVLVEGSKQPAESRNGELPEHSQERYDQACYFRRSSPSEEGLVGVCWCFCLMWFRYRAIHSSGALSEDWAVFFNQAVNETDATGFRETREGHTGSDAGGWGDWT